MPELKRSLHGHVLEHHQSMLEQLLDHLVLLEEQISRFGERIASPEHRASWAGLCRNTGAMTVGSGGWIM